MEKEIKVGIHNCFDFVRRDAKTGEILGEYKAENIMLNNFWNKFLSSTSYDCLKYIHFGTGTATPVATDVKLTTWLGYKIAPAYNNAATIYDFSKYFSDGVVSVKKSIRLEDTEFNGSFISEVGYSSVTSGTTGLLTKALVKDMNGNVVSIEKKSGEVLDIFATFYVNLGLGFDGGKVGFGNEIQTTSGAVIWRMLCNSSSGALGGTYQNSYLQCRPQRIGGLKNTGTLNRYENSSITGAYDVSNKKIVFSVPNLTSSNGNIQGGIRGLCVGGILVDLPCTGFAQPVLTKEVVGTGDGTTKDFQTMFGYIKDNGTCKAYVNDAETSATVDYNQMPARSNIVNDLVVLDYPKLGDDNLPIDSPLLGANTSINALPGSEVIVENPWNSKFPINTITYAYHAVFASDDLSSWTKIGEKTTIGIGTLTIPAEHQNKRYWKFVPNNNSSTYIATVNTTAIITNIHFDTAPANGATVAVTYQPDCIAKDAQHVLNNVKVTLTFNEYTPT